MSLLDLYHCRWVCLWHIISLLLTLLLHYAGAIGEIIEAINAGGPELTDSFGIHYKSDPLEGRFGISSDYGRRYLIGRVRPRDQILYQTERYGLDTFEYNINFPKDASGDYVLVLKFSEVYFNAAGQKIFDVLVNEEHEVVKGLDIFAKVGRGVAHDEVIPFRIANGKLRVQEEVSDFNGKLTIAFVKGSYDNPKINAFYVMKGTIADVPPLERLEVATSPEEGEGDKEEEEEESRPGGGSEAQAEAQRQQVASGPRQPNPYEAALEDGPASSMLIPSLVALACFIPLVLCLCRM